jgi:XTP/dITP diphosphohydrolase
MTDRRRFEGSELVVASHNAGKAAEISDLMAPLGVRALSAAALGLDEPEETGLTFVANAELKARASAKASQKISLADDSGLCVEALGGDPGIYSARWAGASRDFGAAMKKVEDALRAANGSEAGVRSAYFISVLSLCWPDGRCRSFEGRVDGVLVWPPRGDNGFGYDPMFLMNGMTMTFGEMDPEAKHKISHRAVAFEKLLKGCFT